MSIANRLSAARHRQLVGRAAELALFRSAVDASELPFCVLYVFGPGGVGKTTLLRAFDAHGGENGMAVISVDGRVVEPTPEAFLNALRQALGLGPSEAPLQTLAAGGPRRLLLIDTYEVLEPLDGWLRDVFVPQLAEDTLVVLAGRQPPSPGWHADPGLQAMTRVLSLRNFSPDESRAYLRNRAVPAAQHPAVLDFTHGHPLALSLVADVFAQRGGARFELEEAPDVIEALLERFVQQVPGPAHRAALETCAVVRLTTEPLLAHLLDIPEGRGDVRDLFEWLRGLSFIETARRGVFPHDLAREALLADLRWRNPDRYARMHRRARDYYAARLKETRGEEQQRILFDYIFLHRDNAVVRLAFEWRESSGIVTDALRESDRAALEAMTARHEGEESARLLARWLSRQPQGALVFREAAPAGAAPEPVGFGLLLALHQADAQDRDADPATRSAWQYLQRHAPLRPGEGATHFRFWMARDTYQAVSPVQSLIIVNNVRQCVTMPGLAYTFFACADPDFWEPVFAYAEMRRIGEAEFAVGGRRYGVFGNDWRALSPTQWLTLLAEKETAGGQPVAPPRSEPLLVLSGPEFDAAVRDALRGFAHPDGLRATPLLRSRVVLERAGVGAAAAQRADVLRTLLRETAESLQSSPRRARGYRAVYHTYLRPAPTQERAAELLDLPFSTYRRHLAEGVARVAEILWQQEIGVEK